MNASLSVVAGPTGPVTDLSIPEAESALSDVREAYAEWTAAKDRADRYRSVLVEMVLDARHDHGAKLADNGSTWETDEAHYGHRVLR